MNSKRKGIIYQALVDHVAKSGIHDVSTKGLAEEAGVAEGLIFYYFESRQGLFDGCAAIYDRSVMDECLKLANQGKTIYELWDILMNKFLKDPNGAIFYFDYVNSFGFNPTENNVRAVEYLKAARVLLKDKDNLDDHHLLILWDFITTQLFYYVNKIAKHELPDSPKERAFVKELAFSGYKGA